MKSGEQGFENLALRLRGIDYPSVWLFALASLPADLFIVKLLPPIDSQTTFLLFVVTLGIGLLGIYRKPLLTRLSGLQHVRGYLTNHRLAWIGPTLVILAFGVELGSRLTVKHLPLLLAWLGVFLAFGWKIYQAFRTRRRGDELVDPLSLALILLYGVLCCARFSAFLLQLYLETERASSFAMLCALFQGCVVMLALAPPAPLTGEPCGQCSSRINRLRHRSALCRSCRRLLELDNVGA